VRHTRRPLSRAARLTKEWIGFSLENPSSPGEPQTAYLNSGVYVTNWILSPSDALTVFDEPTILRCLIQTTTAFDQMAAGGMALVSYGLIACTELPTYSSYSAPDFDWIWMQWVTRNASAATVAPAAAGTADQSTLSDVRTKRKIDAGQGLAIVIQYEPGGAAAGVGAFVGGRCLYGH